MNRKLNRQICWTSVLFVGMAALQTPWAAADPPGVDPSLVEERATVQTRNALGLGPAPDVQPITPDSGVASGSGQSEGAYVIGPGDLLQFQCFDDPLLSKESVQVLYDGSVSLPLIPDVTVAGLTRLEAEAAVREAYLTVLKDPELTLTVRAANSKYYYVLGDILRPTRYPYEGPVSVLAAINIAGGLRTSAQSEGGEQSVSPGTITKVFVIRKTGAGREVIDLDLSYLTQSGPHPSETPVLPGDFVYVPEGVNLVYILGEVRIPRVLRLAEGQTLTQALTRAGGPVESTAKLKHVILMRPINETDSEVMLINWREIIKTGHDIPLRPGDVVYVPRKGLVRLQEFVSRITGSISPLLSLYSQAYDAAYTDDRYRVLFQTGDDNQLLNTLQNFQVLGSALQNFVTSAPDLPELPDQGNNP